MPPLRLQVPETGVLHAASYLRYLFLAKFRGFTMQSIFRTIFLVGLGLLCTTPAIASPDESGNGQITRVQRPFEPISLPAGVIGKKASRRAGTIQKLADLYHSGQDWKKRASEAGIDQQGDQLLLEVRLQPGVSVARGNQLSVELGLRIHAQRISTLMDAWVPIGSLDELLKRSDVMHVRPARKIRELGVSPRDASVLAGSVITEGVANSGMTPYHAAGADGTGTVLALIDGGFDNWDTHQGTGDWPSGVQLRRFVVVGTTVHACPGPAECSNFDAIANGTHGTSTVEIAYDMAPGATFWVYQTSLLSEWYTALDHASNAANHGGLRADVISASLGAPLDGIGDGTTCPPMWGNPCGSIAEASELARSRGSLVVNAAGNEREDHWGGLYNGDGVDPGGGYVDTHQWPLGGNLNRSPYCLPTGFPIQITAQWDDWANWPDHDYDLFLFQQAANGSWAQVASSTQFQAGAAGETPQEFIQFASATGNSADCGTNGRNYALSVARYAAATDRNLQIFSNIGFQQVVNARSLGFPADSPAVFTVGALDATGSYDQQSDFSSEGPVLAPGGGLPVAPPAIEKPDGMNFSYVSTAQDGPGGTVPNGFSGTSSATPHVAGIAAVLAQMRLEKAIQTASNPAEALHKGLARVGLAGDNDLGDIGHDTLFGHGRIRLRDCSQSVTIVADEWQMVALPCDARAQNTIAATFGTLGLGTYGTDWGIWAWNPASGVYQMLPSGSPLNIAEGYWLYSLNAGGGTLTGLVPDLTEAWAMPVTGTGGLGRAHLLGNPRRFVLDWNQMRFFYDAAEHDFATAVADGRVRSMMWRWNESSGVYDVFNGLNAEGQIAPGQAMWIRALLDVEVRFPTTQTPNNLSLQPGNAEAQANPYRWDLEFRLEAPDGTSPTVRIGHDGRASDGFDDFDAESFSAPAARPFVMVIPRPELGAQAADYVRDIRAPKRTEEWRMEIRAQQAGRATLRWEAEPALLSAASLVDEETGRPVPLGKLGGSIELDLKPGVRVLRWQFRSGNRYLPF